VALLVTLIAMSLVSVIAMALALASAIDRLAASNHDDAVEALNLAESALELAARDLAAIADWDAVLDGRFQSPRAMGAPDAVVHVSPGLNVDLPRLTSELTCGSSTPCSDASRRVVTVERPWGPNNPYWRPFLYTWLTLDTPLRPQGAYVVVWVGDDGAEHDGEPQRDGGGPAAEGRYILRAHAAAFGRGGVRQAIEADLARICAGAASGAVCLPGVRILSWRVVTNAP
jgi:hypothetical protein